MVICGNIIQNIIIRAKFRMVRTLHLTENLIVASIEVRSFVTAVALDCSSSVDHGVDSHLVQGQWIVVVKSIQHFAGELKRPTTLGR